ncbi:hypothetical protein PHABIO_72 [Pseudomonas phage Phabio]|uniref:Uncharacterized protein n=1 Tax=Pseudomonas phage Phabio TaxID=2006668 RepID=A0A1Y0SY81_9CAUD|nr:hypothetical protein MZD05_gp072 [Pseudomonas phage Phabio]ARV76703.1 hypothetical protein PHABIO_72 [Pseudomonas phage Phabio]
MLIVNVLIKNVTKPVEFLINDASSLWELLHIFEKTETVLQYTVSDAKGPIHKLLEAFGWGISFKKFATEFDWSQA